MIFLSFRKIYKVRATSLKEKDEEVIVEDSLRARTPLDNERKEMDAEQSEPGAVERWVIKFEQSVNVLLIVSSIFISFSCYFFGYDWWFWSITDENMICYYTNITQLDGVYRILLLDDEDSNPSRCE